MYSLLVHFHRSPRSIFAVLALFSTNLLLVHFISTPGSYDALKQFTMLEQDDSPAGGQDDRILSHPVEVNHKNEPYLQRPDPLEFKFNIIKNNQYSDGDIADKPNNVFINDKIKDVDSHHAPKQTLVNVKKDEDIPSAKRQDQNNDHLVISHSCDTPISIDSISVREIHKWQELDLGKTRLYLHKAHFDDRVHVKHTPIVRIYAVLEGLRVQKELYCYLWYDSDPHLVIVKKHSIFNLSSNKKIFTINHHQYTQHLISCKGLDSRKPHSISITRSDCATPTTRLPVLYARTLSQTPHNFAVCTVPQYGSMQDSDVAFFVEWMELNRLFGVTEINIYNSTLKLSPRSQRAYQYYKDSGLLNIEQHQTPIERYPANKEYDVSQLGLRSSVNDCILRNIYRYKHILILDRDEVIVPRKTDNYGSLLDTVISKDRTFKNAPAISVRNAFFYRDFDEDLTIDSELISMKYRTHKKADNPFTNGNFIPAKSFINPQYCMCAWNHHCLLPWNGKKFIQPDTALVHHYRSSCAAAGSQRDALALSRTRCQHLHNQTVHDDYILRFQDILEGRVAKVMRKIS